MLRIEKITDEYPYALLYLADPSEAAVADYVSRGEVYGAWLDGELVGEYVLLPTRPFTAELVNLAVAEEHQQKGIGRRLVMHAIDNAREKGYGKIEVGTATEGIYQIELYKSCGFEEEWVDRDFFERFYGAPVIDGEVACIDMIRMGLDL